MMSKRGLVTAMTGLFVVLVMGAQAQTQVKLDISSAFNYDSFGTTNEIAYADTQTGADHTLMDIQGDHLFYDNAINSSCMFADDSGSVGGWPSNGIVDIFEVGKGLARKYDSVDGQTKVNNSIVKRMPGLGDPTISNSVEIVLSTGDQKRYQDINFLLAGWRYPDDTIPFYAGIDVQYQGESTWNTIWSSTHVPGSGIQNDGMFGWRYFTTNTADAASTWVAHDVSTGYVCENWWTDPVDGNKHTLLVTSRTGASYMYSFATALTLDDTKKLAKIKFTATSSNTWRPMDFYVFAATATEAPAAKGFEIIGW